MENKRSFDRKAFAWKMFIKEDSATLKIPIYFEWIEDNFTAIAQNLGIKRKLNPKSTRNITGKNLKITKKT